MSANLSGAILIKANLQDANVGGVIFEYSDLYKTDFRGAKNLLTAYWANAKNIEHAIFDNDKIKNQVINLKEYQESIKNERN